MLAAVALALVTGVYSRSRDREWNRRKQEAIERSTHASTEEALPALKACLEREPNDPELLKATAQLLIRTVAPIPEIEESLDRWTTASPNDAEAHFTRARFYNALTRYDVAITSAERSIALAPDREDALIQHGLLALKLGRWDDAARSLGIAAAVSRQPLFLPLARAELERGRREAALAAIDRELARSPLSHEAHALRATVEYRDANYAAALAAFEKCPASSPAEREIVLFHIGQCRERLGQAAEAKKANDELRRLQYAIHLDAAARQQPETAALQIQTSNAWLAAGEPRTALRIAQESLDRSGPSREHLTALAACYDALGQAADAARMRSEAERLSR